MTEAKHWILELGLEKHPEGGHFRETYRSEAAIGACCLPSGFLAEPRSLATAIYYLLEGEEVSAFHRIRSDEQWFFHTGSPLSLHLLHEGRGGWERVRLGLNVKEGHRPQALVPAGTWFGAKVDNPASFSLVSCTVSPGFDFRDFEIARREDLSRRFPAAREIIEALTP